jgi:hypothetical protein
MRDGPSLRYRVTAAVLIIALITASASSVVSAGIWRAIVAVIVAGGCTTVVVWMWRQDRKQP